MRVATYRRISTDEAHQPYSLDAQPQPLDAYVNSQDGWALTRRFSDQVSGATLERPGLRRALTEAHAGRFDLLLVYRVDRLARSVRGLAQIFEDLDGAGGAVPAGDRTFRHDHGRRADDGADARRVRRVRAGHDHRPVIAGMERKAAQGGWCSGALPFATTWTATRAT